MPFVSFGGPTRSDVARAHAERIAIDPGAALPVLRSGICLPLDVPVSHRNIAVVLWLSNKGPEAVFDAFKPKLPSQVRRPREGSVEVRRGDDQQDTFHTVFSRHIQDLGSPTRPASWIRSPAAAYFDDFWIVVAWHKDVPLACGAGLRWAGEFEIALSYSLRTYNSSSSTMVVYWSLTERRAQEKVHRYFLGRCSLESPIHRFTAQWESLDEPHYWYHGRGAWTGGTPSPSGATIRLATRMWQRLPLSVANALGPLTLRLIP